MYIFLGKNTLQEKNACYLGNFNGETFSSKQTKSPRSPTGEGHIDDIPTAHDSGTVLKKGLSKYGLQKSLPHHPFNRDLEIDKKRDRTFV